MVKKKSPLASWRTMVVGTWCFLVAFFLWFKIVNNVFVYQLLFGHEFFTCAIAVNILNGQK